jgi:hypothetical protein
VCGQAPSRFRALAFMTHFGAPTPKIGVGIELDDHPFTGAPVATICITVHN